MRVIFSDRRRVCIYHLFVWSNWNFLHISQWIIISIIISSSRSSSSSSSSSSSRSSWGRCGVSSYNKENYDIHRSNEYQSWNNAIKNYKIIILRLVRLSHQI